MPLKKFLCAGRLVELFYRRQGLEAEKLVYKRLLREFVPR